MGMTIKEKKHTKRITPLMHSQIYSKVQLGRRSNNKIRRNNRKG